MIIVIEGADLTGKTTVVDEASSQFRRLVPIHSVKVNEPVNSNCYGRIMSYNGKTIYNIINNVNKKFKLNFILDRYILSELIYSEYFKRKSIESINDILNKQLCIIILKVTEKTIRERMKERGDQRIKLEDIININKLFFNFYLKNKNKIRNIYCFNNNNDIQKNIILKHIRCLLSEY